jgi:predicted deacetylase
MLMLLMLTLKNQNASAQLKVIVKLDDFGIVKNNNAANVLDTIIAKKLKVAIGVIAKSLDSNARQEYTKYLQATDQNGQKLIEVWHHGYDHSKGNPPNNNFEFKGTLYQFQKEHFKHGDKLVKSKLGVQMHSFGSPFNKADNNTIKVIKKNKAYKVFLLKGGESGFRDDLLYLNNEVLMERTTGVINYQLFYDNYQATKDKYKDFIVIQGHPNGWDSSRIAEFLQIIKFLQSQNAEFILPYNYYLSLIKMK